MRPVHPYDQPIGISVIDGEIVFLGEGPASFSMTPEAGRQTLHNLAAALIGFHVKALGSRPPVVVLLVEDEPLIREITAAVLEDAGYVVLLAEGAQAALRTLEAGTAVDLLFTDVLLLGDLDGVGLARQVRDRWPAIPLLVTSGHERPLPEALPPGGRFLPKPYRPADVLKYVDEMTAA